MIDSKFVGIAISAVFAIILCGALLTVGLSVNAGLNDNSFTTIEEREIIYFYQDIKLTVTETDMLGEKCTVKIDVEHKSGMLPDFSNVYFIDKNGQRLPIYRDQNSTTDNIRSVFYIYIDSVSQNIDLKMVWDKDSVDQNDNVFLARYGYWTHRASNNPDVNQNTSLYGVGNAKISRYTHLDLTFFMMEYYYGYPSQDILFQTNPHVSFSMFNVPDDLINQPYRFVLQVGNNYGQFPIGPYIGDPIRLTLSSNQTECRMDVEYLFTLNYSITGVSFPDRIILNSDYGYIWRAYIYNSTNYTTHFDNVKTFDNVTTVVVDSAFNDARYSVIRGSFSAYEMASIIPFIMVISGIILLMIAIFGGFFYYSKD
ncbi:MAG: hypothetical protein FWE54_01700 [Methanimicrococcus sp.]|nr:hypothetical protein [Methanimicrococcus sp.]